MIGARFSNLFVNHRQAIVAGANMGTTIAALAIGGFFSAKMYDQWQVDQFNYWERVGDFENIGDHEPTKKAIVKRYAKYILPMTVPLVFSAVIGRKNASWTAAELAGAQGLALAFSAKSDTYKKAYDKIVKKNDVKNPLKEDEVGKSVSGQVPQEAPVLMKDSYSGRYFYSTRANVKEVFNMINYKLRSDDGCPLNFLYSELGLEPVDMGDELGWTSDDLLEPSFVPSVSFEGKPCLKILYGVDPYIF